MKRRSAAWMIVGAWLLTGCTRTSRGETPPVHPASVSVHRQRGAPTVPEAIPESLLLRDAQLIDGTGGIPRRTDILIEAGRIAALGSPLPISEDACVLELDGRTVVPGLIDAHVHLSYEPAPSYAEHVRRDVQESDADRALRAAANARRTLLAGFTTVRNVGGSPVDRALRDAIAQGSAIGPRMLVANAEIGITGGHCDDSNGMQLDIVPVGAAYRYGVADGVDEVRKAVRYQIQQGADLIKVCATGGVMSRGDAVGASQMTEEELRVAVQEAVRAGRRVAAHAHGAEGIRDAVRAGVHSIEHGSMLDAEIIGLMKARGTVLVPTLYVASFVEEQARAGTIAAPSARKAIEIGPHMRESFRQAHRSGVRIALGSDAGVFPHGLNAREFAALVEQGMSPMEAILAGTRVAAELLGISDIGRLTLGAVADLVVLDSDPLTDIHALESPSLVMKEGVLYRIPSWARDCAE